jgi:two-component system nitrogen regulation sensor histidine kinase NtrY
MPSSDPEASPPTPRLTRLPLHRSSRRLSFERRLRLWLAAFCLPTLALVGVLLYQAKESPVSVLTLLALLALGALIAISVFIEQIVRPLQTLANVVAALREDDYSFRARGARRGDAMGDLALEINALAGTLQSQRSAALEALTLVERVMGSMQSPVLAFDAQHRLRLHNAAADRAFGLSRPVPGLTSGSEGRTAAELNIDALLELPDEGVYPANEADNTNITGSPRYAVRRTAFRLRGTPHVLLVLSDVGKALREEERQAWQRLIRVLGHEINNSLTPIKSIAGSLRARIPQPADESAANEAVPLSVAQLRALPAHTLLREPRATPGLAHTPPRTTTEITNDNLRDISRGLTVIEDRAASLNRFLQAYQQLSTLPAPRLQPVPLRPLLDRLTQLETRLRVEVLPGLDATLFADPDQIQQVLINLIQNATDAAFEAKAAQPASEESPAVIVSWTNQDTQATIRILDNGLGLLNPVNLFVPFYTTKPTGSGIGLALAKQILVAHQGTVTLANRPDAQGCIAEVRLPLFH